MPLPSAKSSASTRPGTAYAMEGTGAGAGDGVGGEGGGGSTGAGAALAPPHTNVVRASPGNSMSNALPLQAIRRRRVPQPFHTTSTCEPSGFTNATLSTPCDSSVVDPIRRAPGTTNLLKCPR